jgi:hypothetical protein
MCSPRSFLAFAVGQQRSVTVSRMNAAVLDEHSVHHAARDLPRGEGVVDAERRFRAPSICPADTPGAGAIRPSRHKGNFNSRD